MPSWFGGGCAGFLAVIVFWVLALGFLFIVAPAVVIGWIIIIGAVLAAAGGGGA